jgi:hypothetical protein
MRQAKGGVLTRTHNRVSRLPDRALDLFLIPEIAFRVSSPQEDSSVIGTKVAMRLQILKQSFSDRSRHPLRPRFADASRFFGTNPAQPVVCGCSVTNRSGNIRQFRLPECRSGTRKTDKLLRYYD